MVGLQLSCNARMIAPGGGLSSDNFRQSKEGFSGGLLFSNTRDFTRESLRREMRTDKYPPPPSYYELRIEVGGNTVPLQLPPVLLSRNPP